MAQNIENQKIRPTLWNMAIGETVTFHILKLKSVRTQASELSAMYERQYKTHLDREARTVEVTRVA